MLKSGISLVPLKLKKRMCADVLLSLWVPIYVLVAVLLVNIKVNDSALSPSVIRATKGQQISLHIINEGTKIHNLVIPDFYVFTQNLLPGKSVDVKFVPDKAGTFRYYSDTGGKPEKGIEGSLIIA